MWSTRFHPCPKVDNVARYFWLSHLARERLARDAAKYLTLHRTAPSQQRIIQSKMSGMPKLRNSHLYQSILSFGVSKKCVETRAAIILFLSLFILFFWFWAEGTCAVNSKTRIAEVVILQRRQQEMWVQSLSQEDPLQEEMAKHSSIPAWEIPWMRSLAGYCPKSCKESDTTEWLNTSIGIGLLRFQKEQFL